MDKLEEYERFETLFKDGIIDESLFIDKKSELLGIPREEIQKELYLKREKENKKKEKYELKKNNKLKKEKKYNINWRKPFKKCILKLKKLFSIIKFGKTFKWILSIALFLFSIGCFSSVTKNIIYAIVGLIGILLGLMSCPKISIILAKYSIYNKYKKILVWFLVVLLFTLIIIFPISEDDKKNNSIIISEYNNLIY